MSLPYIYDETELSKKWTILTDKKILNLLVIKVGQAVTKPDREASFKLPPWLQILLKYIQFDMTLNFLPFPV